MYSIKFYLYYNSLAFCDLTNKCGLNPDGVFRRCCVKIFIDPSKEISL